MPAANCCEVADYHSPLPLRFGWLLIQPAEAGGRAEPGNMIQVCAGCADSITLLLWQIANGGITVARPNPRQVAVAQAGYDRCESGGTTGLIPSEQKGLIRE